MGGLDAANSFWPVFRIRDRAPVLQGPVPGVLAADGGAVDA